MNALGKLGRYFYDHPELDYKKMLMKLSKIDWMRSNTEMWLGRTIRANGKVMISEEAVILTCNKKIRTGYSITKEEQLKEKQFIERC